MIDAELADLALEEAADSRQPGSRSLVRRRLLRLTVDDNALLITIHQMAWDELPREALPPELSELCAVAPEGLADRLTPLAVQYAERSFWQPRRLAGEVNCPSEYWRQIPAAASRVPKVVTDRPPAARQDYSVNYRVRVAHVTNRASQSPELASLDDAGRDSNGGTSSDRSGLAWSSAQGAAIVRATTRKAEPLLNVGGTRKPSVGAPRRCHLASADHVEHRYAATGQVVAPPIAGTWWHIVPQLLLLLSNRFPPVAGSKIRLPLDGRTGQVRGSRPAVVFDQSNPQELSRHRANIQGVAHAYSCRLER